MLENAIFGIKTLHSGADDWILFKEGVNFMMIMDSDNLLTLTVSGTRPITNTAHFYRHFRRANFFPTDPLL